MTPQLYTIGFTKKSAERFFTLLTGAGVRRLLDVRLNNTSQLAGFAKRDDLAYFLRAIGGIEYVAVPALAPEAEMLATYRQRGDWASYERQYLALLARRAVERTLPPALFDGGCLLCSEATAERCHRRLAAEYLRAAWGDLAITHLV